jgi:hypothetical protein
MTAVKLDLEAVMEASGELARYRVPSGERVVLAHPAPGGAEILDVPASGGEDCFRVEKVSTSGGALHALVVEYVRQAREMGCCPMGPTALERIVGLSEDGLANALAESISCV